MTLPRRDADALLAKLAFVEGGNRVPFVRSQLQVRGRDDIALLGDAGRHLVRALEDVEQAKTRADRIDRGA